DEALAESERARQLDPLSQIIAADRGAILYYARRFDRAIEQFQAVLAVEPDSLSSGLIVYAYAFAGRYDDALARISGWEGGKFGPWPSAGAAYIYGRLGRTADARLALQKLERTEADWNRDTSLPHARAYIGMGLKDQALASLRQACEEHPIQLVDLK